MSRSSAIEIMHGTMFRFRTQRQIVASTLPGTTRIAQPSVVASENWPLLPVAFLLAGCWLILAWPWLSGSVTIPWDAKAEFQPQVQFLAASLARGELPFWSPSVFAGQVQIADPQSLIFSPPMLLLALLDSAPSLRAVDTTVLLTVLAGGIGVLLLCRDLGWHWAGAIVAALCFQFGASMAWRVQHFGQVLSLAYLPFAFFFLRRALDQKSALYGALAGAFAAFIVLGRDQVSLLSLYLLAGYVAYHWVTARSKPGAIRATFKPLAAGAVTGALLATVPVVLTLLLAAHSNRPSIDFIGAGRGSLHPALLITAAIPQLFGAAGPMESYWGPPSFAWTGTDLFIAQNMGQLYIGAAPMLLLLVGLSRGVLWHRDIRALSVAAVLMLLYALGWYTPLFRAAYEFLPGVSLYRRPADATFLIGALMAMLAGYVAHRLFSGEMPAPKPRHIAFEAGTMAAVFVLAILFAVRLDRMSLAANPIWLGAACVGIGALALLAADWLRPIRPHVAGGLLVAVLIGDLAINNGPNCATALPPSKIDMLEPSARNETVLLLQRKVAEARSDTRRDRVELAGLGFHWPNASMTHGLEQTLGYNPLRLKLYAEATGAGDTVGLPDQRQFTPLMPSYRSELADLLGLRFIATGVPVEQMDRRLQPGDLKLLAHTKDGYVYENPRALPRVLFANSAITADFNRLMTTGRWPDADLKTTVLLESSQPMSARRPGSAQIVSYRNTEVMITADSPDGGWVVLNDVWHPWWFAEIDGQPAPISRANVLFRAVRVPAGRHQVRFSFRPMSGALKEILGHSDVNSADRR